MITQARNEVTLEGIVLEEPSLSHENHGTAFYRFPLEIPRLSRQRDTLPVLIPENLCSQVQMGASLRIRGQLRSFNNRSGIGNKLVLAVYAHLLEPGTDSFCNQIFLAGVLCKSPVFRHTPLGRSICDLMLAVPRRYGRTDYLPIIAWGQLAVQTSLLSVSDPLSLEGRVQSRLYRKVTETGSETRIAYEVSMMHLLPSE